MRKRVGCVEVDVEKDDEEERAGGQWGVKMSTKSDCISKSTFAVVVLKGCKKDGVDVCNQERPTLVETRAIGYEKSCVVDGW